MFIFGLDKWREKANFIFNVNNLYVFAFINSKNEKTLSNLFKTFINRLIFIHNTEMILTK